ncbi:MAG: putative type fimbrial assembly protein PilC [Rhodoglobus sp.]|nr:putative type fimbrial assembly protein PilC [Rhodoglobus sp.]
MSTAIKSFDYKSRNAAGKIIKGKLDASTEGAAVAKLGGMGLTPVTLKEAGAGTGLNKDISFGFEKQISLKDLAVMTRQLSTMISAGLTLLRALAILAEQTQSKKLAAVLSKVVHDVEVGSSLSDAMAKYPRDFPPIMINMVRAGEVGGFLDSALDSIAMNFEKEAKLRSTIKSAMAYPMMVLGLSVIAVILMLLFIVPVFKTMFEGLGSQLPLPTQMLVNMSAAMVYVLPIGVVVFIVFSIWWRKNKNTDAVLRVVDPIKLKLPVFGGLLKKIAVARFTRNLSNMIGAGVPILQALAIVGETSGNWVIGQAAKRVADSVRQGKSIAGPLAEEPVFPAMVVQMIAVGEDSGSLEIMLSKVSDFYDSEVQATTEALTSLIEPLLIAFLGVVVGGMIIALYLPIFSIASVVK